MCVNVSKNQTSVYDCHMKKSIEIPKLLYGNLIPIQ